MLKRNKIFYWYIGLVVIYLAMTFLVPPRAAVVAKYHTTELSLRLLTVSITIPLLAIWFMAFYGYSRLSSYVRLIARGKDGKQVAKIATGVMILAISLPVNGIASAATNYLIDNHNDMVWLATVIKNYINLLLPLIGFIFIGRGTRGLTEVAKVRPSYRAVQILAILGVLVGVSYTYLVITRAIPGVTLNGLPTYFLPTWAVLLTLVVPYVYMWFIGALAAYELYIYNRKVSGIIYRRGWLLLSAGLASIIGTSIILQFFMTIGARVSSMALGSVLLIVYALLALLAVSYTTLAAGAKQLRRIEEI